MGAVSRVSTGISRTAVCAPIKKSGNTLARVPRRARYCRNALPARNRASRDNASRVASKLVRARSNSAMLSYHTENSAYTTGLITSLPCSAAHSSCVSDQSAQCGSPFTTSSSSKCRPELFQARVVDVSIVATQQMHPFIGGPAGIERASQLAETILTAFWWGIFRRTQNHFAMGPREKSTADPGRKPR